MGPGRPPMPAGPVPADRGTTVIEPKIIDRLRVAPGDAPRLDRRPTGWAQTDELKALGKPAAKKRAAETLEENLAELADAQQRLYADDRFAVLVILQAMDAAGKDGTIKH